MANIVRKIAKSIKDSICKSSSLKYLKKNEKFNKSKKVIFICQNESVWNKSKSVFVELKNRGIDCSLLVVNDVIPFKNEKSVFEEEFPDDVILYKNNILKEMKPRIVFYTRTYENYLPKDLSTKEVIKHSNIAYIPYFYANCQGDTQLMGKRFAYRCKYFFADQKLIKDSFDSCCQKRIDKGLQYSFLFGYPQFEDELNYLKKSDLSLSAFTKNKKGLKVMWNPRWTNDEGVGGSNFFKYQKQMFDLLINNDKFSFVFRPHPLLFKNFIEKGSMTQEDKDALLKRIEESTNSVYDNSGNYLDTMIDCDLLVSDSSSLIPEFALLGKPVIYCSSDAVVNLAPEFIELLELNYVADSFEDIEKELSIILDKKDSKKEKREAYFLKQRKLHENAISNIASFIEKELEK